MTFMTLLFYVVSLSILKCYADSTGEHKQCLLDSHTLVTYTKFMNITIFVDAQDKGISATIRDKGQHNTMLIKLLLNYIFEGESIIHIGSHVGLQTLAMSKHVLDKGYKNVTIHALEPNQIYYMLLIKSLYLNNLNQIVRVYKVAAYKQQTQAQIAVKNIDTGSAQIMIEAKTQRKADYKYNVKCISVDQLLGDVLSNKQNKMKIGLVYISANAMEIQVLMGMRRILRENRQDVVVLIEWQFGKNYHKDVDAILQILETFHSNKYKLYHINTQNQNVTYNQIDNFPSILQIKQGKFILIPANKPSPPQLQQTK